MCCPTDFVRPSPVLKLEVGLSLSGSVRFVFFGVEETLSSATPAVSWVGLDVDVGGVDDGGGTVTGDRGRPES
jgi:hypothetical protein